MTDQMDIDIDFSSGAAATIAAEKNKTRGRRQRRRRPTTSVANRQHKQQSNILMEKHHSRLKTENDPSSKGASNASGQSGLELRQYRKAPKMQPKKVHKKTQHHPKKPKQTILDSVDEEKLYRILQKPEESHTGAEKTLLQLWHNARQKAKAQRQQQNYKRQQRLPQEDPVESFSASVSSGPSISLR
jgi:hypothetical protein